MFGKVKQFVVDKAFGFAFMRYDRDNNGCLNKDQLTSMINDAFQLLKVPKQVSWIETAIIMKIFDSDGNDQVSKDQCYNAFRSALAKFGGIGGIAQFASGFAGFGKTSGGVRDQKDQYAYIPRDQNQDAELKISGKLNFQPPEDIDQSMLASLPPVGQNLSPEDKLKLNQNTNTNTNTNSQQNNQWGQQQQNNQWGQQQNNQWGQQNNTWGSSNQNNQQQSQNNQWGQNGNDKQWLSWGSSNQTQNQYQNQNQNFGGHHQHHQHGQQPNQYNNNYQGNNNGQGGFYM